MAHTPKTEKLWGGEIAVVEIEVKVLKNPVLNDMHL